MLLVYFSACIRWRAITLTCMHPLHPHRPQRVDSYEYELPADFVDEEIDEDEAFNSEDERLYGHLFSKGNKRGRDGGDDEGDSDDEDASGSDDDDLLDSEEDSEESGDDEEEDDSELDDVFARAGGESGSEEDADPAEEEGGDEDEEEAGAHEAMLRAVTGGAAGPRSKRPKRDVVVTEAYTESEFNLPAAGGYYRVFMLFAALSNHLKRSTFPRRTARCTAPVST